MGTALEPVPELVLGPGPGTKPETVLELEMVGKVLEPLPELVPGQRTELETMLEAEMEAEMEQDNKHSVLHP